MASESTCKRTFLIKDPIYYVIFMIVLSLMSCTIEAKTRYYKWDVKYEFKSPDCYRKLAITINGMSPGPTITAEQGDTVVVEVTNGLLTENLAIHWHGIRQVSIYYTSTLIFTFSVLK